MKASESRTAARIAWIYVLLSGLWVLLSDQVLDRLIDDPELLSTFQTYKGWGFVLVSGLVLYGLLWKYLHEREQIEQAQRRTDMRYRQLVDQAADGIFTLDAKGSLEEINQSGAEMLGYPHAELVGKNVREIFPAEEQVALPLYRMQIDAGQSLLIQQQLRRKDGTLLPVEISASGLEDGRLQGIMRDISERLQAEEQIQNNLRRLAALRAIDSAITSILDQRLLFNILLDQVISQLHVDAVSILLYKPVLRRLEYAAGRGFRTNRLQDLVINLGEGLAGRVVQEERSIRVSTLENVTDEAVRQGLVEVEGFQSYHGVPLIAKGVVKGVLEVFHRAPFVADKGWVDFLEALAGQAAIAIENIELYESLQNSAIELSEAYDATLEGWSRALEMRDQETQGHSDRVTELTLKLGEELGLTDEELVHMRRGTLLHDIGKMGVPDQILLKPGPLTPKEWDVMRQHPVYAFELISPIGFLRPALDIPYCHHERWDGSGYPRGLKGEQIPLSARIFAVVDVWDALRSNRTYREAWPMERVLRYIKDRAGTHFDPDVTEAFLRLISTESNRQMMH